MSDIIQPGVAVDETGAPVYDVPTTAPLTNTVPLEQAYIPEGTTLHIDGGQSIDWTTGGGTHTITDFTNMVSVMPPTIEHHYEDFNNVNFMLGGNEGAVLPFSPLFVRGELLLNFCCNLQWVVPPYDVQLAVRDLTIEVWCGEDRVAEYFIGLIPNKAEIVHISGAISSEQEAPMCVKIRGMSGKIDIFSCEWNVLGIKNAHISDVEMPSKVGDYSLEEENQCRDNCFFCEGKLIHVYHEQHRGSYLVCPECDKKGGDDETGEDGEHCVDGGGGEEGD